MLIFARMSDRQTHPPAATDTGLLGVSVPSAVAVAAIGLAPILFAAVFHESNRQFYYLSVQEDGLLEWATFWGLFAAGVIFLLTAARRYRGGGDLPWFPILVGLFCVFVAGEEISWGQRVLGYRPPAYFLEENFQQELNLHNVWDTDLRKLLAKATLLVYGVALPLVALARPIRRLLDKLGVIAPPGAVVPVFLGAFWVYETYPWKFSGEIIELSMAFGFLFAAMAAFWPRVGAPPAPGISLQQVGLGLTAVLALSFVTVGLNQISAGGSSPEREDQTRAELAALGRDLMRGSRPISRCGVHKRIYSWVEKYDVDPLREGAFSRLAEEGVPESRVEFFIDPWNSPYWIRHRCVDRRQRQRLFIYSFGPDRRRQSTEWELGGDDVGLVLYERGF